MGGSLESYIVYCPTAFQPGNLWSSLPESIIALGVGDG
jgi:hypothetical protein